MQLTILAGLSRVRAQNLRGWHPETCTTADLVAMRGQLITCLEREARTAEDYAAHLQREAGGG